MDICYLNYLLLPLSNESFQKIKFLWNEGSMYDVTCRHRSGEGVGWSTEPKYQAPQTPPTPNRIFAQGHLMCVWYPMKKKMTLTCGNENKVIHIFNIVNWYFNQDTQNDLYKYSLRAKREERFSLPPIRPPPQKKKLVHKTEVQEISFTIPS